MGENIILLIELVRRQLAHAEALVDCLRAKILELDVEADTLDHWVSLRTLRNEVVKLAEDALTACLWVHIHALNHVHEAREGARGASGSGGGGCGCN